MLRLLPTRHKILAAFILIVIGLADSTALSITAPTTATDSAVFEEVVVAEVSSRAFTEVQIRRLRALLISADQSSQSSIYDRLEALRLRSDLRGQSFRD